MSQPPPFTLPSGLKLEISDDVLHIEYDGDVHIEQNLGRRLGRVRAGGNLTVKLDAVHGDLQAGGELHVQGDIEADRLHGKRVVLGRQRVKCVSITADESITIGAADLRVDAIVAPEIRLDPKADGRVTVIESRNERGATKIKGGFSLADYDDMFGNAKEFLHERGIRPLGPGVARTAPPLDEGVATAPPRPTAPPKKVTPAREPPPPVAPPPADDDEDTDDPLSLSLDDLEPLMEQALAGQGANDDLQHRLVDALARINASYDSADLPPAVEELRHLVEQRDYPSLRQSITEIWNGLLGFHQKRGIRPHAQVTHAFNVIHGLLQS